jgi:hypothetical protein
MSIYSLAENSISPPQPEDTDVFESAAAAPGEAVSAETSRADTLDNLTRFIPTESVTLYVAAIGIATAAGMDNLPLVLQPTFLYWLCAVLTPVIFVILLVRARALNKQALLPDKWPIWKIVAATIAFLVWALAVPGSPYLDFTGGPAVAAVGALFVSTFLSLLDPIFTRLGM